MLSKELVVCLLVVVILFMVVVAAPMSPMSDVMGLKQPELVFCPVAAVFAAVLKPPVAVFETLGLVAEAWLTMLLLDDGCCCCF